MTATEDLHVKLAVYMERLDNYIENQATLNKNICLRIETIDKDLDEINDWRNKFMGAKWVTRGLGLLIVHTTVVLGSIFGMMRLFGK